MADELQKQVHSIEAAPVSGQSTQKDDDPYLGTPDNAFEPPVPLEHLKAWTQMNGTRRSCIDAIVTNTVGLGYRIELGPGHERDDVDAEAVAAEASAQLEALAKRDKRLGNPTLTRLLRAVMWDKQEIGQGYIEIARDRTTGEVSGLFHAPGVRVRRLKDRTGWVMVPADGDWTNAVHFYNFGEKVNYTRQGKPTKTLQRGRVWARNELLPLREYSSESRDYGLPRDSALALEYLGDKLAAESNVGFFGSGGTPATAIFVQGEERPDGSVVHVRVPAETVLRIAQTMRPDAERQARVAIIPLPQGAKVQVESLAKMPERDVGFVDFRDDMRQRTLSAFRLSPIFISLADSGRYTAEVERAITKEQVFDPEQNDVQDQLHASLLTELGYGHLQLVFNDLAVEDDAARREGAVRMAEAGVITRREYRRAYGHAPLPEAAEGADPEPGQVPYGWNDEVVDIGQPRGAENRVVEGTDQRGLRPGIGGRTARSGALEQSRGPQAPGVGVEAAVQALTGGTARRVRGGTRRAVERGRQLVAED
jgi:capsid portal protein